MTRRADPARLSTLAGKALEQLVRGRADLARAPIRELHACLPGHPQVELFRQSAAIIGFDWPARRDPHAIASGPAPDPSSIDIVSFHVDLPHVPSGVHREIDYLAVLAASFESARLRAPRARRILLTDEATVVPGR